MTDEKTDLSNQQSAEEIAAKAAAETSKINEQSISTSKINEQSQGGTEVLRAELEREKAEVARLKEFERGTQEKLREYAEIKKAEQTKNAGPDEVQEIEADIRKMDDLIVAFKNNRDELGNLQPLNTTQLEIDKRKLERDHTRAIRERGDKEFQSKYAKVSQIDPKFTDFSGLNAIILELNNEGEPCTPTLAFKIYQDRKKIYEATTASRITAESTKLGIKAQGQTGGTVVKSEEDTIGVKERKRLFNV